MSFRVINRDTNEYKDFTWFDDAELYFRQERVKVETKRLDFLNIEQDKNGDVTFFTSIMSYITE